MIFPVIAFLFFLVALLYSIAGFGGGSSYIALLVVFGVPYNVIPSLALTCNLIVVTGGCYHYIRHGHFRWALFWPFACTSVPMALVGGIIPIGRELFLWILGFALTLSGIQNLIKTKILNGKDSPAFTDSNPPFGRALLAGGLIGLLSGLVGIGGGIFLAPVMYAFFRKKPKQIAATCALFILINSISGLVGQVWKGDGWQSFQNYYPLFVAVFLGGQIGSRLGSKALPQKWVKGITALLVLTVGLRILFDRLMQ